MAQKDLHLAQMDVKSAYLHSDIEEEIDLEQPQGFVKKTNSGRKLVCNLNKSIDSLNRLQKTGMKLRQVYFLRKDLNETSTIIAYLLERWKMEHFFLCSSLD